MSTYRVKLPQICQITINCLNLADSQAPTLLPSQFEKAKFGLFGREKCQWEILSMLVLVNICWAHKADCVNKQTKRHNSQCIHVNHPSVTYQSSDSVIQLKSTQWHMKPVTLCLVQMSRGSVTNAECYVDWLSAVFRAKWQGAQCVIRCHHICLTQTHQIFYAWKCYNTLIVAVLSFT